MTGFDQAQLLNLGVGKETGEINFAMRPGWRPPSPVLFAMRTAGVASQSITLSPAMRGVGGALFATRARRRHGPQRSDGDVRASIRCAR